jgi:peroxiredoxin
VLVVLVIGVITWVAVASGDDRSSVVEPQGLRAGGPQPGDVAPDFTLTTLDGETVSLSDYQGQPIVLNFWASWCNACREEFPLFREQLRKHAGEFVMLGVDNRDIEADARDFVRRQHADWPMAVDSSGDVYRAYGAQALPQTFFIRRDGTVSQRYYAEIDASEFARELGRITAPNAGD